MQESNKITQADLKAIMRKGKPGKKQPLPVKEPLKYKQITAEIMHTDGEIMTASFYDLKDCCRYIERVAGEHYADSIRIELF